MTGTLAEVKKCSFCVLPGVLGLWFCSFMSRSTRRLSRQWFRFITQMTGPRLKISSTRQEEPGAELGILSHGGGGGGGGCGGGGGVQVQLIKSWNGSENIHQGAKCFSRGSMEAVLVILRKPIAACDYPVGLDRNLAKRCNPVAWTFKTYVVWSRIRHHN